MLFAGDVCMNLMGLADPVGFKNLDEGRASQPNLPVFHSMLPGLATASLSPAMRQRSFAISGATNCLPREGRHCGGPNYSTGAGFGRSALGSTPNPRHMNWPRKRPTRTAGRPCGEPGSRCVHHRRRNRRLMLGVDWLLGRSAARRTDGSAGTPSHSVRGRRMSLCTQERTFDCGAISVAMGHKQTCAIIGLIAPSQRRSLPVGGCFLSETLP